MQTYSEKVSNLFDLPGEEIVRRMEAFYVDNSESEKKSWRNSLPELIKVLKKANLGNLYLITEYELPAGGRIDAVILGDDCKGNHNALIVELKQWSYSNIEYQDSRGYACIKINANPVYFANHPVRQVEEYVDVLKSCHSEVLDKRITLYTCQYLHGFESTKKGFFSQGLYSNVDVSKMFFKAEEDKFCEYLRQIFSPDIDGKTSRDLFLNGEILMPSEDMESLNKILNVQENISLMYDQGHIMNCISDLLNQQAKGQLTSKHMILVSGAAGTGKTILGFGILSEYCKLHQEERNPKMYALPFSRTIVQVLNGLAKTENAIKPIYLHKVEGPRNLLVVDEAHRVTALSGDNERALNNAQIVVILQDDKQRVKGDEVGTKQNYKEFAMSHNFNVTTCALKYQKRSGLGNYVEKIDHLLYDEDLLEETSLGMEVKVFDGLQGLEQWVDTKYNADKSTKYYASYCWEWKSKRIPSAIDIIISDGTYTFKKQWNPIDNQFDWYLDSTDKVGCIYTAQGLGFDYVGLIWWDDLVWRRDHWEFNIGKVTQYDSYLRNSIRDINNDKKLLLNIYRVLLTRAKKGIGIWFKDAETKQHFIDTCLK